MGEFSSKQETIFGTKVSRLRRVYCRSKGKRQQTVMVQDFLFTCYDCIVSLLWVHGLADQKLQISCNGSLSNLHCHHSSELCESLDI